MVELNPVELFKANAGRVAKLIPVLCELRGYSPRRFIEWTDTGKIFLEIRSLARAQIKKGVEGLGEVDVEFLRAVAGEQEEAGLSKYELLAAIAEIRGNVDEYLPTEPRHPLDVKRERNERILSAIGHLILYTLAALGVIRIFDWIAAYMMASPPRAIKILLSLAGLLFLGMLWELGRWFFRPRGLTSLRIKKGGSMMPD